MLHTVDQFAGVAVRRARVLVSRLPAPPPDRGLPAREISRCTRKSEPTISTALRGHQSGRRDLLPTETVVYLIDEALRADGELVELWKAAVIIGRGRLDSDRPAPDAAAAALLAALDVDATAPNAATRADVRALHLRLAPWSSEQLVKELGQRVAAA